MSSRSSVIVAGSTMSACRAVAVQASSCTTSVSTPGKGLAQRVEVLVVMEGIAAGPVDQADIRIGARLAVVTITGAGMEQHVGDARDRNEIRTAFPPLPQRRPGHVVDAPAVIADRAERIGI